MNLFITGPVRPAREDLSSPGWRRIVVFAMRVSFIYSICVILSLQVLLANKSRGQDLENIKVTIELNSADLQELFKQIESQTRFTFAYFPKDIAGISSINIPRASRSIKETLDLALHGTDLEYKQVFNSVVVTKKSVDAPTLPVDSYQTQLTFASLIKGKITTIHGEPMAGVNIIVKGTTSGTTSDVAGQYAVMAEDDDILTFSFIGFKTVEIPVNSRSVIDASLEEEISSLQGVTVRAGYYDVNQKEMTGDISRISREDIEKQPITNTIAAMEGKMPGVYVQENTGLPGGGFTIQIRGQNSLRNIGSDNGNLPFYIVDGVPFTSESLTSNYLPLQGGNPLISINPADIESIEVLKDADATAIYGARGANGVVLITTKKGTQGKSKVTIDFAQGFGGISKKMDLLNTEDYLQMRREAYKNDAKPLRSSDYDINGTWDTLRYTDWQKTLLGNTAKQTTATLSYSGGNSSTRFFISGNYFRQSYVFPGDAAFRRGSGHLGIDHVSDNKKFNANIALSYSSTTNTLSADFTSLALTLAPNAPALYDSAGNLNWENNTWANPLAILNQKYKSATDFLTANSILKYEILPHLSIKTSLGYTNTAVQEYQTTPLTIYSPANRPYFMGSSIFANSRNNTWIVEPQLEFKKELTNGKITALVGATWQASILEGETLQANGYTSDALLRNIDAATSITTSATKYSQYKYNAIFARVNYTLKDRYIINLTARRDGSSRFGPNKQFANFGAIGAAWIFTNEPAIQNGIGFLSFGKLKGSYGITGNDRIGDYQYLNSYSSTDYPYNGVSSLIVSRLSNPNYSWESVKKLEFGIDLGVFKDRISVSAVWYQNRADNQLVGRPLPLTTGQSSVLFNLPALVENRGFEIVLNTQNYRTDNFQWTTSFNVTIPKTTLVKFPDLDKYLDYSGRYVIGKSLNIQKVYKNIGVNSETGIYTFQDFNDDEIISIPNDNLVVVDNSQSYYGGFNNTFRYKGLQLDVFLQFVDQTGASYMNFFQRPGRMSNQPSDVKARWQRPGDVATIQRYTTNNADALSGYLNAIQSNRGYTDASFIRLRNVSISYQIPAKNIGKFRITSSKVFLNAQNLVTISNYIGLSPENRNAQILPPLRMISCGLQINL